MSADFAHAADVIGKDDFAFFGPGEEAPSLMLGNNMFFRFLESSDLPSRSQNFLGSNGNRDLTKKYEVKV